MVGVPVQDNLVNDSHEEIPKAYEPEAVESHWYAQWLEHRCFEKPDVQSGQQTYSIVIPPPNVTGVLTMGHVLNNTIQDVLIRRARQEGKAAFWIPGTDHAGIATQTKVEQSLKKEGVSRHDIGRQAFVERACEWRDKHGGIILKQLQKLGASCAWEHTVHTLDPEYSQAVLASFVELYQRGYIYKGKRMVNWCPVSLTALSDEEVIMKPQQSKLYKMRYEIVEHPGEFLEIATTRPETLMGDTAVAVHPEDERFKHLIGKHCYRPFPKEPIPIVGDTAVEREFGTGALKVTPAHDPLDFEIGQRHDLPMRDIMHPDGTLNDLAGSEFEGMERFHARKKAAEKLKELGQLVDIEEHENNVGYSERADVPIEPRLSQQWFLKYPKVQEAKEAVANKHIQFWPARWEKTYLHWLENIQDWCISRQLWWGHRIPVWYKRGSDHNDPQNWHISLEGPENPEEWEQEEDVLDTWFSSWLWAMATLGWPDEKRMQQENFEAFYPTATLVTGPDIIFFWVARMIMAGLEFRDAQGLERAIPFKNVYFTGIIRDDQGRKMSKSLGNSPDPLELISKYGADGLRFGIMSMAPQGQDIHFSEERVSQGRNFCNKLWNACRFRQMSGAVQDNSLAGIFERIRPELMDADDHAILGRLAQTMQVLEESYDTFSFSAMTQALYGFFWGDFCDWYLEVSKARHADSDIKAHNLAVQDLVIRQLLQMLHPFMPFITEELWHKLGYGAQEDFIQNETLISFGGLVQHFKQAGIQVDAEAVERVGQLRDLASELRALKAQYRLASKKDVTFLYKCEEDTKVFLEDNTPKLCRLVGASELNYVQEAPQAPTVVNPLGTFYLDLSSAIDVDAEKKRLETEIEKLDKLIKSGEAKLSNKKFTEQAPEKVVAGARAMHEENIAKREELAQILAGL